MHIEPYLFFNGRCEEALGFYQSALGAEVTMLLRFKDAPDKPPPGVVPPGHDEKVMHAGLRIGDSTLMASDGCGSEATANFAGFSLSLPVSDEAEAKRKFDALAAGGSVQMPLGKTFWSPCFGMLTDRFGVAWMIGVHENQE